MQEDAGSPKTVVKPVEVSGATAEEGTEPFSERSTKRRRREGDDALMVNT